MRNCIQRRNIQMSKTRANNEGNIKLRADGRYEVRVTVDYDKMTGKPKRVSKYAKTREEAVKLLNQMSFMNDTSPNNFTRVTLGDWLDLCLEVYMKNTINPIQHQPSLTLSMVAFLRFGYLFCRFTLMPVLLW